MHRRIGSAPALSLAFAFLMGLTTLTACQSQPGEASLESEDQKASYGVGLQVGGQLAPAQAHLDIPALMEGIRDGMAGEESAVPQEELQAALQAFNSAVQGEATARAEENAARGAEFLSENAEKEGVQVTESGLQYEVLREGEGPTPEANDQVSIHYQGTLMDGSYDRGEPSVFAVNGVIPGFSEGLQLMPVGSQYRFYIPSELGYGPQGSGGAIGPNSTLIFEVELLDIVE